MNCRVESRSCKPAAGIWWEELEGYMKTIDNRFGMIRAVVGNHTATSQSRELGEHNPTLVKIKIQNGSISISFIGKIHWTTKKAAHHTSKISLRRSTVYAKFMPLLVRSEIHNLDKGGIPLKALIFKTIFDFNTNKMFFFFPFVSFHMFNFIILHTLLFSCPMKRNFNNHINLWRIIKRLQESPHDFCRSSKSLSWDDKSVIVQMPSEKERKRLEWKWRENTKRRQTIPHSISYEWEILKKMKGNLLQPINIFIPGLLSKSKFRPKKGLVSNSWTQIHNVDIQTTVYKKSISKCQIEKLVFLPKTWDFSKQTFGISFLLNYQKEKKKHQAKKNH